ncbi:Flp family type IVb pilin [Rugamonas sp.]|uniref:Flp family type IVb pilin n=1 Tax=Rugamonas sp. TaxID=1926287 RepID=UPI0025FFDE2D|nr:Flp family type IVb pilin [Rugamonas sp.]
MNTFIAAIKGFAADEDGITAIEYGLIAAIMAAAVVTIFTTLGTSLTSAFTIIDTKLTAP